MTRRPPVDLLALTSESAAPMQEALQRAAPHSSRALEPEAAVSLAGDRTPTANLQALAFKVSPAFRRRFKQRATNADMKLNELLFAALDAWEKQQGLESGIPLFKNS